MHIGRLHLRLAGRHRAPALARFDPTLFYTRLRELAVTLDGQPWMVVSGLVEPLTNGGFTRAHSDIDIAIPRDALEAAATAVLRAGFVLTTRILRTHLNSEFDVEAHLRIAPGPLLRHCRRLRLWRLTADGELDERAVPSYIDVFPYVLSDRKLWILAAANASTCAARWSCECRSPGGSRSRSKTRTTSRRCGSCAVRARRATTV
jgi:hypothetical protein